MNDEKAANHAQRINHRPMTERSPAPIRLAILYGMIAALIRLIPFGIRPPNFAANGALGVFGGAKVPLYVSIPIQLASLAASDYVLYRMFAWKPFNLPVYISFVIYALLARVLLRGRESALRVTVVTWLGSVQFFLITNFASWWQLSPLGSGPVLYPATFGGLVECYAQGLLFFLFTLAGDFGCTAMMFGAEAWLRAESRRTTGAEITQEARS